MTYATVAPFAPLIVGSDELTYALTADQLPTIQLGQLVTVPLRGRVVSGVVTQFRRQRPAGVVRIAPIRNMTPIVLPPAAVALARAVQEWYWHPLGLIVRAMLPPQIRRWKSMPPSRPTQQESLPHPRQRRQTFSVVGRPPDRFTQYRKLITRAQRAGQSALVVFSHSTDLDDFLATASSPVERWLASGGQLRRWQQWQTVAYAPRSIVVVGLRSAIFAPVKNLGLLIIDSPTGRGQKDDQAPYYHTARVASLRAELEGAHLVWGDSVVPVSWRPLPSLPASMALAPVQLLSSNPADPRLFQAAAERWLNETAQSATVFILLNRLGAGSLRCRSCGESVRCPACQSVPQLTGQALRCHQCGWHGPEPDQCGFCGHALLATRGIGTESLADQIGRLGLGSVSVIDRLHPMVGLPGRIIIGTEFALPHLHQLRPNHSLVVGIDLLRQRPSFDAGERALRLVQTLRGTCDTLAIETDHPDDPWFVSLQHDRIAELVGKERSDRIAHGYPPATTLVQISSHQLAAIQTVKQSIERLPGAQRIVVFGPTQRPDGDHRLLIKLPRELRPARVFGQGLNQRLLQELTVNVDPAPESLG